MSAAGLDLELGGARTHVHTGGHDAPLQAPTVVLIHGAGHDHSVWQYPARRLAAAGVRVLAPDLPAHGRSAGMPLNTIQALANWIVALVDTLGVSELSLAGHSMGALVALEAASRLGTRARSLALLGAALPMPVAAALLEAARDDRPRAHAMINQWSYAPATPLGSSPAPGMHLLNLNLRLMERLAPGVLHADLSACNAYLEGPAAAARIGCPTLLLCGERDRMTPLRASQGLCDVLTAVPGGARLQVLPGIGHAMLAEAPDAVGDALLALLPEPATAA